MSGIPLDRLLMDNRQVIKDLDAPISGKMLLLCGSTLQHTSETPSDEVTALIAIRKSLDNMDGGFALRDWNQEARDQKCQWRGVLCDAKGHVTALRFDGWSWSKMATVNPKVCSQNLTISLIVLLCGLDSNL